MGENTKIEWAAHTLNPWIGCTKVGPGCDHCYAETLSKNRLGVEWGVGAERRRTKPATWNQARKWDRQAAASGTRPRVFCASLADVFDNAVDPAWRADLGVLIRETPNLDWLLLTKRIGNAADMLAAMFDFDIPANVRIGATIVNQTEWMRDAPKIAAVAVLVGKDRVFLSMEPLLGRVDLTGHPRYQWDRIVGWVIVGGESGLHARPMHVSWADSLRDQCARAGVPFMFKQWGEWRPWHPRDDRDVVYLDERGNGHPIPALAGAGATPIVKAGKKDAGRDLHGVTHDGVPA